MYGCLALLGLCFHASPHTQLSLAPSTPGTYSQSLFLWGGIALDSWSWRWRTGHDLLVWRGAMGSKQGPLPGTFPPILPAGLSLETSCDCSLTSHHSILLSLPHLFLLIYSLFFSLIVCFALCVWRGDVCLLFVFVLFWVRISCSRGCPQTHPVAEDDLLLPLPPECWYHRQVPPHSVPGVPGWNLEPHKVRCPTFLSSWILLLWQILQPKTTLGKKQLYLAYNSYNPSM